MVLRLMTDRNRNINSCLMNMNSLIIRQKINESFIKKFNNGEWDKISNKFLSGSCRIDYIQSYSPAGPAGRHTFILNHG